MRLTGDSLGCRSPKGENRAVFAEVEPLSREQRLHGPGASVFLSWWQAVLVLGEKESIVKKQNKTKQSQTTDSSRYWRV